MKLTSISFEQFRSIKSSSKLDLSSRLNLLTGENGSGKTNYLFGIQLILNEFIENLPYLSNTKLYSDINDIHKDSKYAKIIVQTNKYLSWSYFIHDDEIDKIVLKKNMIEKEIRERLLKTYISKNIINPYKKNINFDLPIFAYYNSNRNIPILKLNKKSFSEKETRFKSLKWSNNNYINFYFIFNWILKTQIKESIKQHNDSKLEILHIAISSIIPSILNIKVDENSLDILVNYEGVEMKIERLSNSTKSILFLVLDLSIKMIDSNPHLLFPLSSNAVVLIDEIELHLHPKKQLTIIDRLLKTFKNTQFIITTNSPIILESINNNLIRYAVKNHISKLSMEDFNILDPEIIKMYPLNQKDVSTYHLDKNSNLEPLMIEKENLTNDFLIDYFNQVSYTYDKMREIKDEEY